MSSLPIGFSSVPRILLRVSRHRVAWAAGVGSVAFTLMAGFRGLAQGRRGRNKELRVDAAADLQTALPVLAQAYEHATGIKLKMSYGSSSKLATQIISGEAADLFLRADYVFAGEGGRGESGGYGQIRFPMRVGCWCCGRGRTRRCSRCIWRR